MRKIDINCLEDLELLKKLKNNEIIYLKINMDNLPKEINSIDMSHFKGQFILSFTNESKFYKITVMTDTDKNLFIFKNTKARIETFTNPKYIINYIKSTKKFMVENERDLESALLEYQKGTKIKVYIKKDFIISKDLTIPEDLIINGLNHTIITDSKEIRKVLASPSLQVILYDKILYIKKIEDLKLLETFKEGNIYCLFKSDIIGKQFASISLKDFVGKIFIDGQGHSINHCKIISTSEYNGLIESIHPYTSLYINDLHLSNIAYIGEYELSGAILGKREKISKYTSTESPIKITNCSVHSCIFKGIHNGIYVGNSDEYMEFYNCYAYQNFSDMKNVHKVSGHRGTMALEKGIQISENYVNKDIKLSLKNKKTK